MIKGYDFYNLAANTKVKWSNLDLLSYIMAGVGGLAYVLSISLALAKEMRVMAYVLFGAAMVLIIAAIVVNVFSVKINTKRLAETNQKEILEQFDKLAQLTEKDVEEALEDSKLAISKKEKLFRSLWVIVDLFILGFIITASSNYRSSELSFGAYLEKDFIMLSFGVLLVIMAIVLPFFGPQANSKKGITLRAYVKYLENLQAKLNNPE